MPNDADRPRDNAEGSGITLEQAAAAIESGQAIVCYTQCYSCMHGCCFDPPQWHTWADSEDIEHAAATGQPDPSSNRCGCPCAVVGENGP